MNTFVLRFADLKKRGIINNWPSLLKLIAEEGFPVGMKLSPGRRGWLESEVAAWLKARPVAVTDPKKLVGAAKANHADRIAADAGDVEAARRLKAAAEHRRAMRAARKAAFATNLEV